MLYLVPREEEAADASASIAAACAAIHRLPDPLGRVLRLAITGSSAAHIAKVTGLTIGQVEQLRTGFVRHIDSPARRR